jgi:hypothetical protein
VLRLEYYLKNGCPMQEDDDSNGFTEIDDEDDSGFDALIYMIH